MLSAFLAAAFVAGWGDLRALAFLTVFLAAFFEAFLVARFFGAAFVSAPISLGGE